MSLDGPKVFYCEDKLNKDVVVNKFKELVWYLLKDQTIFHSFVEKEVIEKCLKLISIEQK